MDSEDDYNDEATGEVLLSLSPMAAPPSLNLLSLLPDPKDMPVADYLRAMGVFCVQIHNILHPVEISQLAPIFCSPRFHVKAGDPEHYMLATSLPEYLSNVTFFRRTNPHYWTNATNLTVDVDEDLGEAVLVATMETHGLLGVRDNLVQQSLYMGHWRRLRNGRWCAWKLEIIRGPGSEPTFF